jgi:hypothetical protein
MIGSMFGFATGVALAILPSILRWIEGRWFDDGKESATKRNRFLTRVLCTIFYFGLEQINIPLAVFWLEHFVGEQFPDISTR